MSIYDRNMRLYALICSPYVKNPLKLVEIVENFSIPDNFMNNSHFMESVHKIFVDNMQNRVYNSNVA